MFEPGSATGTLDSESTTEEARRVSAMSEGMSGSEILRIAGDCKADLIVMGTHARRGLPRYLLGSVAEAVVRSSPIPVLTMTSENAESE